MVTNLFHLLLLDPDWRILRVTEIASLSQGTGLLGSCCFAERARNLFTRAFALHLGLMHLEFGDILLEQRVLGSD